MATLDLINSRPDAEKFLQSQNKLSDDLIYLQKAIRSWPRRSVIQVGESATLYRFLQFTAWKLNIPKQFVLRGSLRHRPITKNKNIINKSLKELLSLDHGTSQWASAAVLLGNKDKISKPPYKLALTYQALRHWKKQRNLGKVWEPKKDATIFRQAKTFLNILEGKKVIFKPAQAEDFCFAYVFGYMSVSEAARQFPSLRGHESNRLKEIKRALFQVKNKKVVTSQDHRVVQAVVMWAVAQSQTISVKYPKAVNKSWPQFWDFILFARNYTK